MPRKQHGTDHFTTAEIIALGGVGVGYLFLETSFDCHQAAAVYQVANVAVNQSVQLESVIIMPTVDLSDDAGGFTGISVKLENDSITLIDSAQGAKANLGLNMQVAWEGVAYFNGGDHFDITILGASADAEPSLVTVILKYLPIVVGSTIETDA